MLFNHKHMLKQQLPGRCLSCTVPLQHVWQFSEDGLKIPKDGLKIPKDGLKIPPMQNAKAGIPQRERYRRLQEQQQCCCSLNKGKKCPITITSNFFSCGYYWSQFIVIITKSPLHTPSNYYS